MSSNRTRHVSGGGGGDYNPHPRFKHPHKRAGDRNRIPKTLGSGPEACGAVARADSRLLGTSEHPMQHTRGRCVVMLKSLPESDEGVSPVPSRVLILDVEQQRGSQEDGADRNLIEPISDDRER